ncbi:MAG TPA: type VI secretion protein IcmF/TssM N-terminal domain-containing protein [Chthoniobacter sp.]
MPNIPESLRDRLPKPQMETFSTSNAKSWIWQILPAPLTTLFCLVTAGSITGLAVYLGDRFDDGKGYQWSMIAIGVMTVIGLGVAAFAKRRQSAAQRQHAAGFEAAIKSSATGWDTAEGDPGEMARLDELRTKFQQGLQVFHERGKDLYEFPWYLMVGESGSGKTEAIRHSELRFPQGLQDRFQGVGGTYSMHWWFTNQAILLDTAGAMLTDSEAVGRFTEFLRLLREYRMDFPINGLLLTLPVDKLLSDPPHVAEEKAQTIARQLSVIQKALEVRFPLYLLVTKSDRLTGFREFFDAEGQDKFELQMVGWSNPDPVGAPFEPGRIQEALEAVAGRLHARALTLLADPVARTDGRRRMDEVDSIYSFPEMIRSLRSRLQCYLDAIFQTGAWEGMTPFFRGIYFTSALREGAELDEALAAALNTNIQQLPAAGIFTKDKAVFLRDVFLNKIFLEHGLVTRLRNVAGLLRRRLLLYYGAVLLFLAVALLGALLVRKSLTVQLAGEQAAWLQANATWNNGALLSPLTRQSSGVTTPPNWVWADQSDPLAKLDAILDMSSHRLRYAWVFSPLPEWRDFEQRRHETGLSLFEASVLKPLLDAARERIRWDTAVNARPTADTGARLADAYCQLARLETWTHSMEAVAPADAKGWQNFFEPLLAYVLSEQPSAVSARAARLAQLTEKAYGSTIHLPSRNWLAENEADKNFSALTSAASFLFGQVATQALGNEDRHAGFVHDQERLLHNFLAGETTAKEWSQQPNRHTRDQVENECLKPMRDAVADYDALLAAERGGGTSALPFASVSQAAQVTVDTLKVVGSADGFPLRTFQSQAARLAGTAGHDGDAPSDNDTAWTAARRRLDAYEKHFSPVKMEDTGLGRQDMIGNLRAKLQSALDYAARFAAAPTSPASTNPGAPAQNAGSAPSAAEDEATIDRFLESYRGATLISGVLTEYLDQLQRDLAVHLRFPLVDSKSFVHRSLAEFQGNCEILSKVEGDRDDLSKMVDPNLGVPQRDALTDYFSRLKPVFDIKRALSSSGVPGQTEGLFVRVDGAPPLERTQVPTLQVQSGGLFGKSTVVQSNVPVVSDGVKDVTIKIGGSSVKTPPTGQFIDVGYNGFDRLEIIVTKAQSGREDARFTYGAGDWGALREAIAARGGRVGIGGSGLGWVLISRPALPFGRWPKRANFGLPE